MLRWIIGVSIILSAGAAQAQPRLVGDLPRNQGKALVELSGLQIEYGQARTSEGIRLRTILTRPKGATGRLPAIMLTQWVSCGSLDFAADRQNQLRQIADRSGMVLVRIDRSGTGDSEGAPCSELDYDTEVRHYREAFDQVARHPWIDPRRIILFGSSLGATTAPLVAEGKPIAGIVVQGGGALTHLERMINFDRIYLERSSKYTPAQIHAEMNRRIPFQVEYLVHGKMPEQIERERPELRGVWASIRGGAEAPPHYGRPYAWHQQAAKRDFLEAWSKVQAPVLVFYGEYDQFETRHGHKLIADTVNRIRPGAATFIEVVGGDHELEIYRSPEDAYAYRDGRVDNDAFIVPLLDWLRKVTAR